MTGAAQPAIWVCFAETGNIRAWTRHQERKQSFELSGLTMSVFYSEADYLSALKQPDSETQETVRMFRSFVAERDARIERLQRIVCRYGDRIRMSNAADPSFQQEIDEAFEAAGPYANYSTLVEGHSDE